ncbi:histidine decarboxylase [Actinoplanes sp. NPDC051851]|uniref:histidine decarboxylase n=1 Tax=Actinoplanes sp. NPDC051851 TaxID=3154753 RepID=UPI0034418E92
MATAAPLATTDPTPANVDQESLDPLLREALHRLAAAEATNVGYPRAADIDYSPLAPFLRFMINNVGDSRANPTYPLHTMELERSVLNWFATLLRAGSRWTGYLATGSTEGTLHSLRQARAKLIDPVVFHSTAAHYSAGKAARVLGLPTVVVDAGLRGEMDYADLSAKVSQHSSRAAIVVATIGTTMTEAVDSVPAIRRELDAAGAARRWIHADAALAGAPLALSGRRDFDLAPGGADSVVISGHKWWGTPIPCAVTMATHQTLRDSRLIAYVGNRDTTITGSRSGLSAALLWHAITNQPLHEQEERVTQARAVAAYACHRLASIGWPCWRNLDAITVVLRQLPKPLAQRWPLPVENGWSHVICMPGITTDQIDHLVTDLEGTLR